MVFGKQGPIGLNFHLVEFSFGLCVIAKSLCVAILFL